MHVQALQEQLKSRTQLADVIVERALQKLKDLGCSPRTYMRSPGSRPAVWTLSRGTTAMIGREAEVSWAVASLQQHGAALIWGGPGEGKLTVAMDAAARLRADEPHLHAFRLDMRGEAGIPPSSVYHGFICMLVCMCEPGTKRMASGGSNATMAETVGSCLVDR